MPLDGNMLPGGGGGGGEGGGEGVGGGEGPTTWCSVQVCGAARLSNMMTEHLQS